MLGGGGGRRARTTGDRPLLNKEVSLMLSAAALIGNLEKVSVAAADIYKQCRMICK